jgi:phosphoribosylamine--glycine ligase
MKRVLVIGNGGREHTLVWKIKQSSQVGKVYCAPGNAGTALDGENVNVPVTTPFTDLADWAEREKIDLTVVGPEQPLVDGLVDVFTARGLRVFGPGAAAARIEGSKSFAKEIMTAAGIPTGAARRFESSSQAIDYVYTQTPPVVVKADGLAAGKGVSVCPDHWSAEIAIHEALDLGRFGNAGKTVLIEKFLDGEEASILAIVGGGKLLCLPASQDHKRALDGDQGLNTGGMGAYSPAPVVTPEMEQRIIREILLPTVAELARRGIPYCGVLYAGLMISADGPKVIEYNCRFGDPETQAVLPRVKNDLVGIIEAAMDGTLDSISLEIDPRPAVCVVVASGGYPESYEKGKIIQGLELAGDIRDVAVFHAGTKMDKGKVVTSGGRVLGVTGLGNNIQKAVDTAYQGVRKISFEKMFYRKDIAHRALARG